jgi:hypothetical protein
MKALLIRVGIDSGAGGGLAPVFPDGSFEYIPIPEDANSVESRRYCTEEGRSGILFSEFVPKKYRRRKLHYDPEFQTNTYGDYKVKRMNIVEKGDIIAFYAGLVTMEGYGVGWVKTKETGLYLIGKIVVSDILHVNHSISKDEVLSRKLNLNAHFKRHNDSNYYICKGFSTKSGLLDKAVPISKKKTDVRGHPYHAVSPKMEKLLGISGSIQRSVPVRIIREKRHLRNLQKLLNLI